eukprot:2314880-Amphidinium_carterae.4
MITTWNQWKLLRVGRGGWHLANGLGQQWVVNDESRCIALIRRETACIPQTQLSLYLLQEGREGLVPEGNLRWICLISPEGAEIGQLIET